MNTACSDMQYAYIRQFFKNRDRNPIYRFSKKCQIRIQNTKLDPMLCNMTSIFKKVNDASTDRKLMQHNYIRKYSKFYLKNRKSTYRSIDWQFLLSIQMSHQSSLIKIGSVVLSQPL